MIGARIKPMFEAEAKERQRGGQGGILLSANLQKANEPVHAAKEAAQSVSVSPRSVESASKVLSQGSPELIAAVESGEVAVSTAAEVATLPQFEQREVVAQGKPQATSAPRRVRIPYLQPGRGVLKMRGQPEIFPPFSRCLGIKFRRAFRWVGATTSTGALWTCRSCRFSSWPSCRAWFCRFSHCEYPQ